MNRSKLIFMCLLFGLNACSPIASNVPKNFGRSQPLSQQNTDRPQNATSGANTQPVRIRIMNFQTHLLSNTLALPIPIQPANNGTTIDYKLKPEQIRNFLKDGILRLNSDHEQNSLVDLEKTEFGEIEIYLSLRPETILREMTDEKSPLKGLRAILKYEPPKGDPKSENKGGLYVETHSLTDPESSPWVLTLAHRHANGLLSRLREVVTDIRIKAVAENQP